VAVVLTLGALNNETTLVLPFVYFLSRARLDIRDLWGATWRTAAIAIPPFLATAVIRWATRDRPRLAALWQWDNNISFLRQQWHYLPFQWYKATSLFPIFMFGALWLFAYLNWKNKTRFMRASLVTVPLLLISSMVTGMIQEIRLLIPLAFVVIPAAFHWMFPSPIEAGNEARREPPVVDGWPHSKQAESISWESS
jgi:hypothetical protein